MNHGGHGWNSNVLGNNMWNKGGHSHGWGMNLN